MATPAQIHANRMNAQKSTGPASVEGKAAVRFNALKHGGDAASLIIPGEDPAEFDWLRSQYHEQFCPVGPIEEALLDTIVRADWNQRRFARIEAQVIATLVAAVEPSDCALGAAFHHDAAGANALQKLFRRQQAAQRDWYRAIGELRAIQQQRAAEPESSRPAAVAALRGPSAAQPSPCPGLSCSCTTARRPTTRRHHPPTRKRGKLAWFRTSVMETLMSLHNESLAAIWRDNCPQCWPPPLHARRCLRKPGVMRTASGDWNAEWR
jgi:hypothetical protein